jgi:hypothetical protein
MMPLIVASGRGASGALLRMTISMPDMFMAREHPYPQEEIDRM